MTNRRRAWDLVMVGLPALAVLAELVAVLDGDPASRPWTDLITTYVPPEWAAVVLGALAVWLPLHFALRYYRRRSPVMSLTAVPDPVEEPAAPDPGDRRAHPLAVRAALVVLLSLTVKLLVRYGVPVPDEVRDQLEPIADALLILGPALAAWWAHRHVWSPRTVNRLLDACAPAAGPARSDPARSDTRAPAGPSSTDPGVVTIRRYPPDDPA